MKLRNLFETTNLTPDDVKRAQNKNLIVDIQHDGAIYVVTDIPPISKQQLRELYKASFEPGSFEDWVDIKVVDPEKHWNLILLAEPGYQPVVEDHKFRHYHAGRSILAMKFQSY